MNPKTPFRIVAIDGPAGAGKSTVAREVARRLGYLYLDTGALYRAATLFLVRQGVEAADRKAIGRALSKLDLRLDPAGRVFLGGADVSVEIRSREVSTKVSSFAAIPEIRRRMVALQQAIGRGEGIDPPPKGLVAEGRDIGTVVFPAASHKFFLVASLEERAKRRQKEFVRDGQPLPVETVTAEIAKRDEQDSKREHSPLKKAEGAVEIDTTGLSIEDSVREILRRIEAPRASA